MAIAHDAAIEPMQPDDRPAVEDLIRASDLPPAGFELLADSVLVAKLKGDVVGCVALEIYADAALLRSLAVAVRARGTGLAVRLTEAALDLARSRGATTVYLLTETAAGFFPRFGFRRIERDHAAAGVRGSIEFTKACPSSAVAMALALDR